MNYRILLLLLCLSTTCGATTKASAKAAEVRIGCSSLHLVLDPHLTPAIVKREWFSGNPRTGKAAVLELRGCKNELLDRLTLESSLAKLDPTPLRGAPLPTYPVSADLTEEVGSYSGPLTILVQIDHGHLTPASAQAPDGKNEPIHLAVTGKQAWKKAPLAAGDDLLSVSSQRQEKGFITVYRRYHPTANGWTIGERLEPGLWESDSGFPEPRKFPRTGVPTRKSASSADAKTHSAK